MADRPIYKQCRTCPWRVGAQLSEIPGYHRQKHRRLRMTIAEPSKIPSGGSLRIMACHHSTEGSDLLCVGWAHNQLGVGNNLGLRLRAITDSMFPQLKVMGAQRATFVDTLSERDYA